MKEIEHIDIKSLKFDPKNARKHSKKNISAIIGSLKKFGQQKPIVIDNDNTVIAGNGTLAAAKEMGWTTIDAVRSELEGTDKKAYSLADNRTAELADWDTDVLEMSLTELTMDGFDIREIGFDLKKEEKIQDVNEEEKEYLIVCICPDEMEQERLFNEFSKMGIECKIM